MRNCCVSFKDLQKEVRLILNETTMDNVEEIFMERSGKISIIKNGNKYFNEIH